MKTLERPGERDEKWEVHSSMKQTRMQSLIVTAVVILGLLVLAVLALDVDLSFLHVVGEHKRAYVLLGTGVVCLLGSSVETLIARSKARGIMLSLVLVLGVIIWATLYGMGGYLFGDNVHWLVGPVGIVPLVLSVYLIIAAFVIVRRNERRLEDERETFVTDARCEESISMLHRCRVQAR